MPAEIRARFVVDALLNVSSYSLGRKPNVPPAAMNDILRRLALRRLDV